MCLYFVLCSLCCCEFLMQMGIVFDIIVFCDGLCVDLVIDEMLLLGEGLVVYVECIICVKVEYGFRVINEC